MEEEEEVEKKWAVRRVKVKEQEQEKKGVVK
jgi:hypothetical protein